jgi:rhodanese-related sulfurtransferase/transcriptional regulator with XRE-family HTH domain
MVRNVAASDAKALIANADIDVIDVREPHEYATGHVPGARLVPLGDLKSDPSAANIGKRVLFVCESGGRSQRAGEIAESQGASEVYTLEGGTRAWRAAGLPIEQPAEPVQLAPAARPSLPVEDETTEELGAVVGANFKRLRAERGLTLDLVAGLTGVGRQTLGQIENGRAVPSLGTLWKIARAFEVPFSVLLAQPTTLQTRIFRRANAKRITDADGRFSSRALFSPDDKGGVEFYEIFLAAHHREEAEPHARGTREHLLVTQGRLVLELGTRTIELGKGDAVAFTADVRHAYVNPGNEECWMSLVMTYATPPA